MPPERPVPGSPADWLQRARSDLALAGVSLPDDAFYEDLCFHAQQAAEKAIKGVYRAHQREFRYTHDIAALLNGLKGEGIEIPEELQEAVELTGFARQARYPGTREPTTEAEYRRAVTQAEAVVRWAESLVGGRAS